MLVLKSAGIVLLIFATVFEANASMRCGTSIINEGDLMAKVLEKCGEPDRASAEGPALRANGVPQRNAATLSEFVYGPANGAYRYLHFIDEKLIRIEMRRD